MSNRFPSHGVSRYDSSVRRRGGTGLTRNEQKVLAAALRLHLDGVSELYGYELFSTLSNWEGEPPMNHGTLYRGLRALEQRGAFVSREVHDDARLKVLYELTGNGVEAARRATIQLAALDHPPGWVDIGAAAARGTHRES